MKIVNETRFFGMLGFAMRAGKIDTGTDIVCRELPKGNVKLVIVSSYASAPTKKKIMNKCGFYGVTAVEADVTPEILSDRLGKTSTTVCVAVRDENFSKEISDTLSE